MKALAIMTAIATVSLAVPCFAQTSDVPLVQMDFGDAAHPSKFSELERGVNTSTIKVVQEKGGGAVGQSMFVTLAFYEVAEARHYQYFANLREWTDKDGGQIYVVGFTNKKDADLKEEFGTPYGSAKLTSTAEFGPFLEKLLVKWHEGGKPDASTANSLRKAEPTP